VDVKLIVVDDREQAAARAAGLLVKAARDGLDIALAGGSTPRRSYELAAERNGDWRRASIWWGDERCVPPQDPRSNFRVAREGLLVRLAEPPAHVHRIRGELPAAEAAEAYERELGVTRLGLILLGLGPDGHTASLFPGSPALDEQERRVVAGPPGLEPMVDRVTLTVPALNDAAAIVFLAVGGDKAAAAARAFGAAPAAATPASLVRSRLGTTTAILDRDAATLL
jgi:6-phosphogluconolactonase